MTRFFWAMLLGLSLPISAFAQDSEGEYSFDDDDDFVIVGEVQKPEVTVVISRENLNKSYQLELKESFLPKIIDAVKKAPF